MLLTVKSVIEAHTLIEAHPLFCKRKPQNDVFENENGTCGCQHDAFERKSKLADC